MPRGSHAAHGTRQMVVGHDQWTGVASLDLGPVALQIHEAAPHVMSTRVFVSALAATVPNLRRTGIEPASHGVGVLGHGVVHHQQIGVPGQLDELRVVPVLIAADDDRDVARTNAIGQRGDRPVFDPECFDDEAGLLLRSSSMSVLGRVQYHDTASQLAQILIDADGIPGNRIDPEYRWVEVELANVRQLPRGPSFAEDGLCFVSAPCGLSTPERFDAQRSDYEDELRALLETTLGADEVVIFDHTLRGRGEGRRPPSFHVHCDYNAHSATKRMRELMGEERASRWSAGHFAVVNVWRPLVDPVERSPLGFVLPSSVARRDWIEVDIVFPDRRGQVRGLRHDPSHRWIHQERMRPDEAAIFTVYANDGVAGVPHAAVELVGDPQNARPRQSIESRAFVRFDS